MPPSLQRVMEKRAEQCFDNQGFVSTEKEPTSNGISRTHSYPMVHVEVHVPPKVKVRKRTQIFAAIAANMGAFALGAVLAWSATALPSLREDEDIGHISKSAEAWIGSIVTLGAVAACPAAGYSMVRYGRRLSMLMLTAPFVLGWLLIAFAEKSPFPLETIYFGRVLTGFCGGAFTIISPVFIAESAHVKIRGGLAAGFDLMLSIGMLYIYVIGAYFDYKIQALSCAIVPVVCHAMMMIVPESPRFLVERGRTEEAARALKWFFGLAPDELAEELDVLTRSVIESQAKPVNFRKVVMKLSVLKPILICVAVLFFYTMSAVDAIIFYAVDIFESTGSNLDPKESTMILGAVQVIATIPAAFMVDHCGRRLLLIISEFFMFVALLAMGIFFSIAEYEEGSKHKLLNPALGMLPLVALNVFIIAYSVGVGPLALMMMGELVPSHIKGMTACGVLMIRWVLGFGVTNLFETLEHDIGVDNTYYIFSVICFFGVIFVFFCVPETKGKTLDEIQIYFISKDKLRASLTPLSRTYSEPSLKSLAITNDLKL